jgi:hypothetical protein
MGAPKSLATSQYGKRAAVINKAVRVVLNKLSDCAVFVVANKM